MDLLDVALTRFEQLAPALKQPETMTEVASDDCEAWLRGPVCAVVARLVSNERFRRLTRWSVDRLGQGAGTPERTQVETVDSALVRLAEATVAAKKEFLASSESRWCPTYVAPRGTRATPRAATRDRSTPLPSRAFFFATYPPHSARVASRPANRSCS